MQHCRISATAPSMTRRWHRDAEINPVAMTSVAGCANSLTLEGEMLIPQ